MLRRGGGFLLVAVAGLGALGCTCRAWYEGLQARQRQERYQNRSEGEVWRCLDEVNRRTYDA